jgi:hypothetical protein
MRVIPLLILFVCGLCVSVAPERRVANDAFVASGDAADPSGQAQYEALQAQANLALDMLRQARERRLSLAQLAVN